MKIVAGWVLGLAFAAASVNGFLFSTSRFNLVDRKYDFSDVAGATWQGEALPGRSITLRGTLQEIRRSIAAVNPEFLAAYNETSEEIGSGLKKRWKERKYDCQYGESTDRDAVKASIEHLRATYYGYMQCGARPGFIGHGTCSRVSCDGRSGIWLCNDNSHQLSLPCREVAAVAESLWNKCSNSGGDHGEVRGQLFTKDDWNVIIRNADC